MDSTTDALPPGKFSSDLKSYSADVTDVKKSVWNFLWRQHPLHSFFIFIVPASVSLALVYYEFAYAGIGSMGDNASQQAALLLIALPLTIPLASYWRVKSRMRYLFYTELAAILDCTYSDSGNVPPNGTLFSFGNSRRVTNVLSGTYKSMSLRLFDYTFDEGSGKDRHVYHYTVGELATDGKLPEVLCIPEKWNGLLLKSWRPSGAEALSLEGDFNAKFLVYVPKGQEMEALQVLEPDVMAKLMDGFEQYGFECIDSYVYLFTKGTMTENRENVLTLFSLLKRFDDLLLPDLQSFLRKTSFQPTT